MEKEYYGEEYWEWQAEQGMAGAILDQFKFEKHLCPGDTVLDFGCGGGFLLATLNVARKIGFDINPSALNNAKNLGIEILWNMDDLPSESVDTVITNHCLEHVPTPLEALKSIFRVLKNNGLLVAVLPCEQSTEDSFPYKEDNICQHLYTWCPQSFGNLVKFVGFKIESCTSIRHQWTPAWQTEYKNPDYHQKCEKFALENGNYQIKCVARKSTPV